MVDLNKLQALSDFWSGFGIVAYDENTVPENAEFPRITYNVVSDSFGNVVALHASVWDYGTGWRVVSEKAESIATAIGIGGKLIPYDGGAIWLKRGTPFAQRMSDENDMVRRIYINIEAEFLSAD